MAYLWMSPKNTLLEEDSKNCHAKDGLKKWSTLGYMQKCHYVGDRPQNVILQDGAQKKMLR